VVVTVNGGRIVIDDADRPAVEGGVYVIGYIEAVDGYRHAWRDERSRKVRYSRTPNHAAWERRGRVPLRGVFRAGGGRVKVYLAARYSRGPELVGYRSELRAAGHVVTSRWLNGPGSPLRVEFVRDRLRFLKPGETQVGPNNRPPFGCCLLIWQTLEWTPPTDLFSESGAA